MSDNVAHALAGAGGGIVAMALTYPLMTVSVRNQVAAKSHDAKPGFQGQIEMAKKIIREEGLLGLYSGLESALFGIALTNGVYYYWYEWVKAGFEKAAGAPRPMSTMESLAAGALAGSATAVATNPIWVINTRLTAKKDATGDSGLIRPRPKNTWEAFVQIVQDDGPAALWQGIVPALILVINPIIQYTVFEQLKARMESSRKLTNFDFFLLGAVSKLCATGITYPYIVVKSRMQLKSTDDAMRYTSVSDGFSKILANEGVAGLYKGLESKLLQSILTSAFLFMSKEILFSYAVRLLVLLGARPAPVFKTE